MRSSSRYTLKCPNPVGYIRGESWTSLSVPGRDVNGLEKAIWGYTSESTLIKDGTEFQHTSSQHDIRKLIFEYLKVNDTDLLKEFRLRTIRALESPRINTHASNALRLKLREMGDALRRLCGKPTADYQYTQFEPLDTELIYALGGGRPLDVYRGQVVRGLVGKGLLRYVNGTNYQFVSCQFETQIPLPFPRIDRILYN